MLIPVLLAASAAGAAQSGIREKVNFDFGWRHKLGNASNPQPNGQCSHPSMFEVGFNWGTGGSRHSDDSATDCCARCASYSGCGCWDYDTQDRTCWTKTECSSKVAQKERITAKNTSPPPPPAPIDPPQSKPSYDDSSWELVNAPHDMLIAQGLDENANNKMGYYMRNVGWYRKHFSVPSDWKGSTVWVYIEGVFHESTFYLNGKQLAFHPAGYTSFWLRIDDTDGLAYGAGENVLAAYVDASTGTGWWYEAGGLIRHNWLVRADPVHISPFGTWVYTNSTGTDGAIFQTETNIENHGDKDVDVVVKATLYDADGTVVETASATAVSVPGGSISKPVSLPVTVASGVKKWNIQTPVLYTAAVELIVGGAVVDGINLTTGHRDVRWDSNKGLFINDDNIKMRGFCDHSNFGGVGGALPDRLNLFRTQVLRSVGGNAWRMAHNPPSLTRLDYMDALGMVALDENRDYGGQRGQGGETPETVAQELVDMGDMIQRDRSHPSVIWWSFCNEVGCNNESSAKAFREISKLWDPTRAVTQNHHGTGLSTDYLDVQGFSHKRTKDFQGFHKEYPTKPMAATECCSCMSQRGVDVDVCPNPKDGGCTNGPHVKPGVFYNNNIGSCTSSQVVQSDELDYVAGTFVWSGFDYLGEARGWPQNTKCRGTVADVAGFTKETAYWLKSTWLSNISKSDPGRPINGVIDDEETTVFIIETWQPPPAGYGTQRHVTVYSNAPTIQLELNGKVVGTQRIPDYGQDDYGQCSFSLTYAAGNLTAVGLDAAGKILRTFTAMTPADSVKVELTIDVPSAATGTGDAVVADGEDVAMLRATIIDSAGRMNPNAMDNMTFKVVSGPGKIWATHNGDPANTSPSLSGFTPAYHGLARAYIRTTSVSATSQLHRRRLREIDLEGSATIDVANPAIESPVVAAIVVEVTVDGLPPAQVSIPVTTDLAQLPMAVAVRAAAQAN